MVCIDDFALKKRQRYGTVMVDIETHKIVDMLPSREKEDVKRWLTEYPNLSVVSRDGSHTYAAAIAAAHPGAMQISDRFHLIKGLTDYATLALQKLFQGRIGIPLTSETRRLRLEIQLATTAERVNMLKTMRKEGRSKNELSHLTGLSLHVVNRYLAMQESTIPKERQTVRGLQHEEAVRKLQERADKVRDMYAKGFSLRVISQSTGFTYCTVKNYLSADFSPVNAHYGKQREGKLEPFRGEVLQMRLEGTTYREIHRHITEKGYSGTVDAIRVFMSKERRIQQDLRDSANGELQEYVDKKWLIRLLYKPLDKLRGITETQLTEIFKLCPLAECIIGIVSEFRVAIKSGQRQCLLDWIVRVEALKIPELDAFLGGLKNDIDAVINAVEQNFSNGLAEGTVNKIKVIKRVMYGRCNFDTLRNKCLAAQLFA